MSHNPKEMKITSVIDNSRQVYLSHKSHRHRGVHDQGHIRCSPDAFGSAPATFILIFKVFKTVTSTQMASCRVYKCFDNHLIVPALSTSRAGASEVGVSCCNVGLHKVLLGRCSTLRERDQQLSRY